ncbi:MAG TPA: amidohydrolase [Candidatus Korarchaeota archaeon]|nr:amidohydrolase [Candidatus Korarchaeota archaeon]
MVDLLIKHGYLLTMKGEGVGMVEDGALAIEDGQIVVVGKTDRVLEDYPSADLEYDAKNKAVLPGFVDAHIHTRLTLLRGQGQDVPEIEWMLKTMKPFQPYMREEHVVKGSALGVLEAVKSGSTCFCDIGRNMSLLAERVYGPSGVRAVLGETINEIGPDSMRDPNELYDFDEEVGEISFKKSIELIEKWNGFGKGRITCVFAPHAVDMMSKNLLLRVKEEAQSRELMIHIHVAQGGREEIQVRKRYGKSAVAFLNEIGYLDSNVIAAHCHQTTEKEVKLIAERGVHYVSCPSSIGLIDGITPPLALYLMFGGVAAGIGTDQASGNNSHNMLVEMKVAALLNKTRHRDPTILPAWKVLRIATIEGARCLGLDDRIGSLEPGKRADLIILNLRKPHMTPIITDPVRNIAPNIVYSARGDEVETVIVEGKVIVEEGKMLTLDEEKVIEEAQEAAEEVTMAASEDYKRAGSRLVWAMKQGLL